MGERLFSFTIFLIDDSCSKKGKQLLKRLPGGYFSSSRTVDDDAIVVIDIHHAMIEIDGKEINLEIWDIPGVRIFHQVNPYFYTHKVARGFVLLYDITDFSSFESVHSCISLVKKLVYSDVDIMLIGSNCHDEYRRKVATEEAAKWADEFGVKFMEVSAKKNINVDKVFFTLARDILSRHQKLEKEIPFQKVSAQEIPKQQTPWTTGVISSLRKFLGFRDKNELSKQPPPSSKSEVAKEPQRGIAEYLRTETGGCFIQTRHITFALTKA